MFIYATSNCGHKLHSMLARNLHNANEVPAGIEYGANKLV